MEYWWEAVHENQIQDASSSVVDSQQDLYDNPSAERKPEQNISVNPLSSTLQKLLALTKMYSSQAKVSELLNGIQCLISFSCANSTVMYLLCSVHAAMYVMEHLSHL